MLIPLNLAWSQFQAIPTVSTRKHFNVATGDAIVHNSSYNIFNFSLQPAEETGEGDDDTNNQYDDDASSVHQSDNPQSGNDDSDSDSGDGDSGDGDSDSNDDGGGSGDD